jgi:hypothetical protein
MVSARQTISQLLTAPVLALLVAPTRFLWAAEANCNLTWVTEVFYFSGHFVDLSGCASGVLQGDFSVKATPTPEVSTVFLFAEGPLGTILVARSKS